VIEIVCSCNIYFLVNSYSMRNTLFHIGARLEKEALFCCELVVNDDEHVGEVKQFEVIAAFRYV